MLPGATLQLHIDQQFARLGLESKRASLEIRQPRAQLQIVQRPARMEIDQGPGTLQIDGEDAWSALGRKPTGRMLAEIAEQDRQIGLQAIAEIAEKGDQLAQIHGSSIADLALQQQEKGILPAYQPDPPAQVHITYTPHPTRIHWQLGGAEISATPRPPEVQYHPGYVRAYLLQQNWIHFSVKGRYMHMIF